MTIRLKENVDFRDKASGTDLVTELYDVERAAADESR